MPFAAIVDDQVAIGEMTELALRQPLGLSVGVLIKSVADGINLLPQIKPDIVILDNRLEDGCGMELLLALRGRLPQTRWLLFSGFLSGRILRDAMSAGVDGAVARRAGLSTLLTATREVLAGRQYFCEITSATLRAGAEDEKLTPREREIIKHVAAGRGLKEIASKVGVAYKTVLNVLMVIRRKTGAESTVQISDYARKQGLAEPRWWQALQ
jgi:DNA-binding NarL/FixJ family response regulator